MDLSQLIPAKGARRKGKQLGRGRRSGHGKTSTRGQKGQMARSGRGPRLGLEGGQMPLIRRLPKRGFINEFKTLYRIVNLGRLNGFKEGAAVGPAELESEGIIDQNRRPVKVLAGGTFSKRLQISAHRFSRKSLEVIEKAGGTATVLSAGGGSTPGGKG